jgi:replicative DNA helicase
VNQEIVDAARDLGGPARPLPPPDTVFGGLLGRLADVRPAPDPGEWFFDCPSPDHDGGKITAKVWEEANGKIGLDCQGGCNEEEIAHALGYGDRGDGASEGRGRPERVEAARFRDDLDEPDFIPFTGAKVPPFPVDALPAGLARYVEAVATHLQVPADGPALIALATIAAAGTRRIRVRRLADDYEQPLNLYLLGLGEPGERKSQIVAEVVRPLREHEAREAARLHDQIALEAQRRLLDEDRQMVIRRTLASGKAKGDPQALRAELDELTLALAKPPLRAPRLVTSAPTQGALEQLLADNGERMAILGAEGGVFGIVAGRFSGNGKAPPDMDILLGAWSGDAGDSDRVTRPGTRLKAPALTIGLFVQPQVFREMSDIYGADEKGLTSRFLIALVESRAHTQEYFGRPMDRDRVEAWARQVRALLDGLPAGTEERIITLPSEVLAPAKAFHDEVTSMMADGGPLSLPSLRAFGSKLRGQVERLIGVLHVAEHGVQAPDIPCTEDTVARAARLGRYFLAHGMAARSAVAVDPVVLRAQRLVARLVYQGTKSFTRRDVQMNRWAGRKPEEVDQVLRELVQRGYLKQGRTERSTPGATGPVYTLTAAAIASTGARK